MQSMFAIRIKTVDQHVTSDANLDEYTGVLIFLQIMRGDIFFFPEGMPIFDLLRAWGRQFS